VRRLPPEFGLTSTALTDTIEQASTPPTAAPLSAPLRFICYCLQPLIGAYDKPTVLALRAGGLGVVVALGLGMFVLGRRRERWP
jgi:hypothetical protein